MEDAEDPTHKILWTQAEWFGVFHLSGFSVKVTGVMEGINDKWARRYPGGQGIFILQVPSNQPKAGSDAEDTP